MASILDFFKPAPAPEAKAVTGPGAFSMTYHTPLHSWSRDPNKLMAEAQGLFRTSGWVGAAERALGGLFIGLRWHLEDEAGETIDSKSPEAYQEPLRLLQRPTPGKLRSDIMGLTFRHVGLCGNSTWYLDQRDLRADTPLSIMYLNPARLTPATDQAGNVTGWVLDHPDNQVVNARTDQQYREGVPLKANEVIHFTLDEPDWGIWGIGIAEAAQRKLELDRLADQHAGGTLASGGRLSGLVSPKAASTVTDDQWVQFVRDWRSITSDPDAAKRLQIAKMPLDFTQMTASLKELQFHELMVASRDTIFGMWGVPIMERGMTVPGGLNSDLAEGYKEVMWQTVKERSELIRETIQVKLLDRWEAKGIKVTLVYDYPEFDDKAPLYEAAAKSISVALTNNERRAILSLDPLDDEELGKAVYIDGKLARIDKEPEAENPQPPVPPMLPPVSTDDETEVIEGKASTKPLLGLRARTEVTWEPRIRSAVQKVLEQQKRDTLRMTSHLLGKPKDTSWWNEKREDKRLMDALDPLIETLASEVVTATASTVNKPAKADSVLERILSYVRTAVGSRVTSINRTTREKIQAAVAEGVQKGMSPSELGNLLETSAAFDEARAEMIARTETAYAYNDSAIGSYRDLGVEQVEVIDGDMDDVCAHANGATWSMDEARSNPIGHPNCTRDFIPVLAPVAKAAVSQGEGIHIHIPAPQVTVNVPAFPKIPAPVINLPAPSRFRPPP